MQKRRFGRTDHDSSVIIFGAFAVGQIEQEEADAVVKLLLEHGVNHIDVAPTYAEAELRLGPWLERFREKFFVGCKTEERSRKAASEQLHHSLERLRIDAFDLYQLHAVTSMEELAKCSAPGGSMEAILDAREKGLTRYIGITSHGLRAPAVHLAALEQFDFDTLLFPLNPRLWSDPGYRQDATELLGVAAERDVGTMVIKSFSKGPWGDQRPRYHTWYEPHDDPQAVEDLLCFALSQPISGVISAGDARLLPTILSAAERFEPMESNEQAKLVAAVLGTQTLFP